MNSSVSHSFQNKKLKYFYKKIKHKGLREGQMSMTICILKLNCTFHRFLLEFKDDRDVVTFRNEKSAFSNIIKYINYSMGYSISRKQLDYLKFSIVSLQNSPVQIYKLS